MSLAPSVTRLHSPFLSCPLNKLSSPATTVSLSQRNQRSSAPYPCIRAELDQNTVLSFILIFNSNSDFKVHLSWNCCNVSERELKQVVAISVGLVSVAVGIGIPIFYETQIDNAVRFYFKLSNLLLFFFCSGPFFLIELTNALNSVWLSIFWCRPSEKILSRASPAVAPVLVSNSLVLKLNLLISLAICIFDNWARRARAYVISSLQFKHWLVILKLAYGFMSCWKI